MTLSLRNQRMIGVLALVALATACSGNGPPATITPDPTNPMNPMGYHAQYKNIPTAAHSITIVVTTTV